MIFLAYENSNPQIRTLERGLYELTPDRLWRGGHHLKKQKNLELEQIA